MVFKKFYQEISEIDIVGDIRHKGMLMGIELVTNRDKKTPIHPKKSINKIFYEEGKKQGIASDQPEPLAADHLDAV